ncbi:MAG TPA: hypothetical protein PK874_11270 [Desulfobacteraceae bacterium]|nr:hypothetical protein [Desulfobacteraceae bacterium]HPJ66290.1 hypothetical protein [Desulfobacteraceae bacterium]HPQ29964.1 hypothetical protein [Desulfobacteraceae bacterium]
MLAQEIILEAGRIGYKLMRLDTMEILKKAMKLYESFGFEKTTHITIILYRMLFTGKKT